MQVCISDKSKVNYTSANRIDYVQNKYYMTLTGDILVSKKRLNFYTSARVTEVHHHSLFEIV